MSNDQNDRTSSPTDFSQGVSDPGQTFGHLGEGTFTTMSVLSHDPTIGSAGISRPPASPPLEAALEFRVVRPGAPVRRLRLTGNRYTFGSGEGCSIRLDDPSLRPMHAVLLRDAQRILMRAYSVPLEHNGSRVAEAVLRLGDIIRMGNYRFELLSAPTTFESSGAIRTSAPGRQDTALKDRLTELSQQWHVRHAECEARERRCDQRETALHGRETELWSRVENLQRRENLLVAQESAAREIQETYAATQEELRALREREGVANENLKEKEAELELKSRQLRERKAELERRQEDWKRREDEFERRNAEGQQQLEQARQQADAASDAVGRMREEFSSLNNQLSGLRERHSELQEREKREQEEHERLRSELEATRDAAVDAHAKSESLREESEARRRDGEAKREAAERELQRVTSELQSTRQELAEIREESRKYQETLNQKLQASSQDLQAAREEAEHSRRSAEEEQAYAEKRLAELEEQLADFQKKHQTAESVSIDQLNKLQQRHEDAEAGRLRAEEQRDEAEEARQEVERIAGELRDEIEQLQERLAKATDDASQLKVENEGANASIRQLELLVDQTKNNQSAQQDSWSHESEQLQKTIEDLSVQFASANAELGQLRSANEALTNELRDAQLEIETQPDPEQSILNSDQFQTLEKELESARQEIERLQDSHAETVARLEAERKESESALRDEIEQLRDEITSAQASAEARIREISEATRSASIVPGAEASQPEAIEPAASEPAASEPAASEPAASEPAASELEDDHDAAYFATLDTDEEEQAVESQSDWNEAPTSEAPTSEALTSETLEVETDECEAEQSAEAFFADDVISDHETAPEQEIGSEADLEWADPTEVEASTDQLVESGESIWRLEGAPGGVTDEPIEASATEAESEFQQTVQLDGDPQVDSWQEPSGYESSDDSLVQEHASESEADDIVWQDEAPENAVADVIEDIEHNLEEAISGYQPPSESPWGESVAEGTEATEPEATEIAVSEIAVSGIAVSGIAVSGIAVSGIADVANQEGEQPSEPESADHSAAEFAATEDSLIQEAVDHETASDEPSAELDEPPQPLTDTEVVRQYASRPDADSDTPLDWSAYMPGEAEAEADQPEQWAEDSGESEPVGQLDGHSESDFGEHSVADESATQQEESQHVESIEESGWDTSSWNADEPPASQQEQNETATEIEDSIEVEASVEASQPYEMTEQWSGPESVEGIAAEPAFGQEAEPSAQDADAINQVEEESDRTAEPDEEAGRTTGSLAEMLIRDLSAASREEPATQQPESSSVDEIELQVSQADALNAGDEEESIEPTFVLQSDIDFAEEEQDASGEAWNLESPSHLSGDLAAESDVEELSSVGFEPIEEIVEDVSQTAVTPENETVVAPDEPVEDDSIEAYMSRLLQRVQGGTEAPAAPEPVKESEAQQVEPEAVEEIVELGDEGDPLEESGETSLKDSVPLVPRSQAPELSRNLSAMRELANQSARNAVARSIRVQARDTQMKAVSKGLFMVSFIAAAIVVYLFVDWSSTIKFAMIGAFLVLAAVFGQEGYVLTRDAKRRLALAESSTTGPEDDQAIAEEIQRIAEEAQEAE